MKVCLVNNRTQFEISGFHWKERISVRFLASRLRFYRALRDRSKGAYALHYIETVEGLERIERELTSPRTPHPGNGGTVA